MNNRLLLAFVIAIASFWLPVSAQASTPILIKNGTIYPVVGEPLEQADLLIEKGRIKKIRKNIRAPKNARVIDAKDLFVYPGLIAPMTAVGVTGYPNAGDDLNGPGPSIPHMRAYDGLNPDDDTINVTRIDGITTVATISGTENIINGQAVALNLNGNLASQMLLKNNVYQLFRMNPDQGDLGPSESNSGGPTTHPGIYAFLKDKLDQAKYADEENTDGDLDAATRALIPVVKGEVPVVLMTNNQIAIRNAIRLIKEYKLNAILHAKADILRFADQLAAMQVPVIWDGAQTTPRPGQPFDINYHTASVLEKAGVFFAFNPPSWGPIRDTSSRPTSHHARNVPEPAALSVAHGLSEKAAIEAITIRPAKILGIDKQVGSLEVGKTANVVIWSGSPLQMRSQARHVIIEGNLIPLESYQTELRDKYDRIVRERMSSAR